MNKHFRTGFERFLTLLFREIKDLGRFPYFESILFILIFQTISKTGVHFEIWRSLEESNLTQFISINYFQYLNGQISGLYLIIALSSSILSYLSISYRRDIGFMKTEFSFPISRIVIYLAKFLGHFLILFLLVFTSVSLSSCIRNFDPAFVPLNELILYLFMVFTEAFSTVFLVTSITVFLSFLVKKPILPLVISFLLLYVFQMISFQLRNSILLLPFSLGSFEERFFMATMQGTFSLFVFEPLLPSILFSLVAFFFGYYFVVRRMQIP